MEENRTAPAQGGPATAMVDAHTTTTTKQHFNPRESRAITALLSQPQTRKNLDRIIGTTNSPDLIRRLRQRGFDIPCNLVAHTDRDGRKGFHGVYRLSPLDFARLGRSL